MHSLERRLADQNELESWIDCNERRSSSTLGLPHRWVVEQATHGPHGEALWWRCRRPACKVSTRTTDGRRPSGYLT